MSIEYAISDIDAACKAGDLNRIKDFHELSLAEDENACPWNECGNWSFGLPQISS